MVSPLTLTEHLLISKVGLHPDLSQEKSITMLKRMFPNEVDMNYQSPFYFAPVEMGTPGKIWLKSPELDAGEPQIRAVRSSEAFIKHLEELYPTVTHVSSCRLKLREF
jgi:hypothetical protein